MGARIADDGTMIFQQASKMSLEGIVSKRLSAPYHRAAGNRRSRWAVSAHSGWPDQFEEGNATTCSKVADFNRGALALASTPCPKVMKKMHTIALSPTNNVQIASLIIVIHAPIRFVISKRIRRTSCELWKRKRPPLGKDGGRL
jgi:hypothetical protein